MADSCTLFTHVCAVLTLNQFEVQARTDLLKLATDTISVAELGKHTALVSPSTASDSKWLQLWKRTLPQINTWGEAVFKDSAAAITRRDATIDSAVKRTFMLFVDQVYGRDFEGRGNEVTVLKMPTILSVYAAFMRCISTQPAIVNATALVEAHALAQAVRMALLLALQQIALQVVQVKPKANTVGAAAAARMATSLSRAPSRAGVATPPSAPTSRAGMGMGPASLFIAQQAPRSVAGNTSRHGNAKEPAPEKVLPETPEPATATSKPAPEPTPEPAAATPEPAPETPEPTPETPEPTPEPTEQTGLEKPPSGSDSESEPDGDKHRRDSRDDHADKPTPVIESEDDDLRLQSHAAPVPLQAADSVSQFNSLGIRYQRAQNKSSGNAPVTPSPLSTTTRRVLLVPKPSS
jgi:outer membrane biosynthesis protein TonB